MPWAKVYIQNECIINYKKINRVKMASKEENNDEMQDLESSEKKGMLKSAKSVVSESVNVSGEKENAKTEDKKDTPPSKDNKTDNSQKSKDFNRDKDAITSGDFKNLEKTEEKKKGLMERLLNKSKKNKSKDIDSDTKKEDESPKFGNIDEVSRRLKEVSKHSENTQMDLEKLTGKLEAEKGFREGLSEKTSLISEEIGELRSMILDREKNLNNMDTTFEIIKDQVHDMNPQRIKKEFEKKERELLESAAKIERLEGILEALGDEMKKYRIQMDKIKNIENVLRVGDTIDKKLEKLRTRENYIEKTSAKVEQIFADLNMRTKDIVGISAKVEGLDELSKDLLKTTEQNSLKLNEVVFKEDLTKEDSAIKKSIEAITKKFQESLSSSLNETHRAINEILPIIRELEKETENLKALQVLNPLKLKKLEELDISKAEKVVDFEMKLNNIEQGLVGLKGALVNNVHELDTRINLRTERLDALEKQMIAVSNENKLLFSKYETILKDKGNTSYTDMIAKQAKEIEAIKKSLFLIEHQLSKERNAGYLNKETKMEIQKSGIVPADGGSMDPLPAHHKETTPEQIKTLIEEAKRSLASGNIADARLKYKQIKENFSLLEDTSEKPQIYEEIMSIYNAINT